ncbi:hypothetical protein Abr02nite_74370 [Paractinoplanes brasiliensis]|nr:hypothetical protein Abr02nite_74370 [Actinoplanes brasiliensis]
MSWLSSAALALILAVPGPVPAAAAAPVGEGPQTVEDVYRYLEDPELTAEGQEEPHADLRPYPDARTAAADVTRHELPNPYARSLNGSWQLKIFDRPDDVPAGFRAGGAATQGWPTAGVPHTWQSDFLDHPMFRNIPSDISPDDPPRVPRDVNPTGAYVKTFDLPADWAGGRVFLRFEGVTSNYLVWVNGAYTGYDQGGYTPAEFDVTDRLRPGRNTIAVQVHRWGSGAYLEDVDQWRYSGIFRDVWLYRTNQARLRDAYITTDLDADHRDATLRVAVDRVGGTRTRGTLLDAEGRTVATMTGDSTLTAAIENPAKWSAEEPHLYTLVLQLLDDHGKAVHTTAQPVGFREIEVRDRQILVNGERILVKGTNRAETDPDTGRHVTRQAQRDDVALMKRLHLNAVRTSHYPSDPYFYDLADRHGCGSPTRSTSRRTATRTARRTASRTVPSGRPRSPTGSGRWSSGTRTIPASSSGTPATRPVSAPRTTPWRPGPTPTSRPGCCTTSRTTRTGTRRTPTSTDRAIRPRPVSRAGCSAAPSRWSWASTPTRWATASATSTSSGRWPASIRSCRAASSGTGRNRTCASPSSSPPTRPAGSRPSSSANRGSCRAGGERPWSCPAWTTSWTSSGTGGST